MIKIGKRIISNTSKPLIVAEIGINHFGSLKIAKKIVDEACKNNVEAIKVQIHIPDEEMNYTAKKISGEKAKEILLALFVIAICTNILAVISVSINSGNFLLTRIL